MTLRLRLLLAFALLTIVTAAAVAGAGYVRARDAIVQRAQDNAVIETTNRVEQLYPLPARPVDTAILERVAARVSGREGQALAYGNGASAGGMNPSVITAELRSLVSTGRVGWQRVSYSDGVWLVVGMQLRSSSGAPSGIEVYVLRPFTSEIAFVDELARNAWLIGGAVLILALGLGFLAARGVLRPVRELQLAAWQLGQGDLSARVPVRGRDELASVASTFNSTASSLEHHVGELRRMEADARRFVADVSHELRTPLAAMTAVTDVLDAETAALPGVAGQAARLVNRETLNLTRLVNDLIEVTRFDSGTAALALDDVDVAEVVRTCLRMRGFEISAKLPDGVRARLDPRRLDVIVANLVGNALRHGAAPVSLVLSVTGSSLVIEVADSGLGLPAEVLPHVFARFYKADSSRGRSEGSGLGLAIAWENARLHGGTLVAANRPGGGALFTLRLPLGGES
ncbi:two-component system, OmpR family, sensor histidine kinase MtrB [Lentzea waywayandensis]|uniref:Signal transduction histidine-protein kinase/phosphatase MprB n=1 Tax=Lentzea waywayandensis TaxID=84724 RepID=A0A1I6FH13_9PSEU|nr:ATP-binding protein [Lentzea waywayandensis]SFR29067.1 two-component system, OmpR family, sensor histidine kinase MtrB [Lentzea waywayandensis]